jgi:L-fuconolactonase
VIDAHVHFWDPGALAYPWLDGLPALRRAFLPADYAAAIGGAPVERLLFVEANARPEESEREIAFVERLAAADPRIAGVVAFVDLTAADAGAALERAAARPLVRGVRHNIQGEPAGFALQPSFVEGVRAAGRLGLVFDLCATHDQLAEVERLVRRCPDTRFVLDHCGKPAVRDGALDPWRADVARLAAHERVHCKLSGLLTEADPARRRDANLLPYAEHVTAAFGPGRLLFGSDWPVVTLAGSWGDWRGFVERFTAAWSAEERRAFDHDNAADAYGIVIPSGARDLDASTEIPRSASPARNDAGAPGMTVNRTE